jgi:arginyl-tRNA synthetase
MVSFKTRLKETIYERLKGVYPVAIAQETASLLDSVEGVVKAEVAGGGFLNLWLDKAAHIGHLRNNTLALRQAAQFDNCPHCI